MYGTPHVTASLEKPSKILGSLVVPSATRHKELSTLLEFTFLLHGIGVHRLPKEIFFSASRTRLQYQLGLKMHDLGDARADQAAFFQFLVNVSSSIRV
jgi:hypothetical protein